MFVRNLILLMMMMMMRNMNMTNMKILMTIVLTKELHFIYECVRNLILVVVMMKVTNMTIIIIVQEELLFIYMSGILIS